ncbi:MAG: aldolase/citrate lyase family protein [Bacteriovorax sp.]|nr:aldolase/citrate lyase family protein [Bacteriovorax sp.]
MREIPYYNDYVTPALLDHLMSISSPVEGVPQLVEVGTGGGLETKESLLFLCELYDILKGELNTVLSKRQTDRKFIDQQTKASYEFNNSLKRNFVNSDYKTILGNIDSTGRIVIGPKNEFFCKKGSGKPIAKIPEYLQGNHVTLFGPPDDTKLSINAMNAYHRKLKNEPKVIAELLKTHTSSPKWGADDEDSKTPLRADLISAGINLTECFDGTISFHDEKNGKDYNLEADHLSLPIKRFPGLALPSFFLFYRKNPIPLHLYDFALHLFKNWHNPKALAFYVPKLENEEEARYIRIMMEEAEKLIQKIHPEYVIGTIRLMIVLENPRAVFRVNEIMDELYPYFVGASLGWHDYLASTARLFKEDANYRIPVKADPNIVIKYIKASHHLLADVVGSRGGIKVGGMYGILPISTDLESPSFQVTMKGFIKDVITQLKRDLSGFWVAHPDFVRIGLALVEGWKQYSIGEKNNLETLVKELLDDKYHHEILSFIAGADITGLDITNPLYPRSLIVADINESNFIANNHPDEIRYNVFQSLQYLTDWLSGNGCVALPAQIDGTPVRVMDDLATAERSRWEVWHEIYHNRFALTDFLKIAHEEMHFIRKDLSNDKKIVQVKWDERTEKWYPVALNIMIRLMTDNTPVEFAPELLLPFTIPSIRESNDPWTEAFIIDPDKYRIDQYITRFNYYFGMCGSIEFAKLMAPNIVIDYSAAEKCILAFNKKDILEAASFHGDIGESKKTLDAMASNEQKLVLNENQAIIAELGKLGHQYREKFGMKFLVSAKDKSGSEILVILKNRINNSHDQEILHAKEELWKITNKRMTEAPLNSLNIILSNIFKKHNITGAMASISTGENILQTICFGESVKAQKSVNPKTWFEMASLSKTIASAFALEYFAKNKIALNTTVNSLFEKTNSKFRIKSSNPDHTSWANEVTLADLMSHSALNMHYVNGVPANKSMPGISDFLDGNIEYGYAPIEVINKPGENFQYSGGGFLVLEHLLETLENKSIKSLTRPFLNQLGMHDFSFDQTTKANIEYAHGYLDSGKEVEGSRKMFPSFAAGSMGTAHDMNLFLHHLTSAFHSVKGSGPISHDSARIMLYGTDKGCMNFMGVKMGLGIFTAEAGPNKLAIHQGANDGFRALYIHCYEGPNIGQGLTLLCSGEMKGVLFNSEIAQAILKYLNIEGIDFTKFKTTFEIENIPQEEIVNIGYKNLVFKAFLPSIAEAIIEKGPLDPLASFNVAVGGKILEVTNQKFARAENLLSDHLPTFNPELFGVQGKIMDSWETVRHNQRESDVLIFELKNKSTIEFVSVSTKFHLGNQVPFIQIEGFDSKNKEWKDIIPKTDLQGHALKNMKAINSSLVFEKIKVSIYPDGGLTRLGLYSSNLPANEKSKFQPTGKAQSVVYTDEIAKTLKPLAAPYFPDELEIKKNWQAIKTGDEVDVASAAYGGSVLYASNEHYGPAIQTISPFAPMHMFDGFESARSREKNHSEEVVIKLGKPARIHRIMMDFSFFVNNNPLETAVLGLVGKDWVTLVARANVKAFAGNLREFAVEFDGVVEQVKVVAFPDGGVNRVRVYSKG